MTSTLHTPLAAPTQCTISLPSWLVCAVTLGGVQSCLRIAGLGRTLRLAKRYVRGSPAVRRCSPADADSVARRVAAVAAFVPGRALCLEQSITLYVLLRRAGADVALRIGVQPYPFLSHSWVELRGQPVAETYDKIAMFLPISGLDG